MKEPFLLELPQIPPGWAEILQAREAGRLYLLQLDQRILKTQRKLGRLELMRQHLLTAMRLYEGDDET